jgi:hypothetical protein
MKAKVTAAAALTANLAFASNFGEFLYIVETMGITGKRLFTVQF